MDAYAAVFRHVLMPIWEGGVRGRPLVRRLSYLERTQWEPRARVRALQLMELRRLLVHAEQHIPYYRELFATTRFDPRGVRSIADLAALPPLTKAVMRERYEDLLDVRTRATHVHKRTSGSSGDPHAFEYDRDSEVWRQATKWRGWSWAGYRPGTRALVYWGMPIPLEGVHGAKVKLDRALKRERYVDCLPQDDASLLAAVRAIQSSEPKVLIGYSIAMGNLARFILERGLRDWGEIAVVGSSELLVDRDRAALRAAFGPVFDTYGSRETMLLAAECEMHEGLHTLDDVQIVEVVSDGKNTAPGESGDVLVTDLHNYGMPLIRYQNGDLAVAADDEPCGCGRGLGRIARVAGRRAETLRDADGRQVSGMLIPAILANQPHQLREIQAVQRVSGELVLRLVTGPGFDPRSIDAMIDTIRRYLRGVPVRVEYTSHIDRGPSGKHRLVVVERPKPEPDGVLPAAG